MTAVYGSIGSSSQGDYERLFYKSERFYFKSTPYRYFCGWILKDFAYLYLVELTKKSRWSMIYIAIPAVRYF